MYFLNFYEFMDSLLWGYADKFYGLNSFIDSMILSNFFSHFIRKAHATKSAINFRKVVTAIITFLSAC